MGNSIQPPAEATYWLIQGRLLFLIISVLGAACFAWIVAKRMRPLIRGERDLRFDRPLERLGKVIQFWFGQWRHPRYRTAGIIHLLIFAGFIILVVRAFSLLIFGINPDFVLPGFSGEVGHIYGIAENYAATVVFLAMIVAAVRRIVFKPARYATPARYGKRRAADAIFLLALIAILMLADAVFEGSKAAADTQVGHTAEFLAPLSLSWSLKNAFLATPLGVLGTFPPGSIPGSRTYLFLPPLLPPVRHSVSCGDLPVQHLFREAGQRNSQAGEVGRSGRRTGPSEITRGEKFRGFHVEAHARFLLLRRLRPLFGPVSGERCG
jgi:hypothetical protein